MENGSFQSLLQLAVALNIGFAAIATFMGSTLSKEKEKVELLFEASKAIRDMTREQLGTLDGNDRRGFRAVTELRNEVTLAEARFDNSFNGIVRLIALLCAFLSFLLLVLASFFESSRNDIVAWLAILVNLPLLAFVGYAYYVARITVNPLRAKRQSLDARLSSKLQRLVSVEDYEHAGS